jgi:hypothetical protein
MLQEDINSTSELAQYLTSAEARKVVLVIGHSPTVPELIQALGAPSPCPTYLPPGAGEACWIPDNEFDHLFIVTVQADGGTASVTHQTYGVQ